MVFYMILVVFFVAVILINMIFVKLFLGCYLESCWVWLKFWVEINGIIVVLVGILVYGGVYFIGLIVNYEMRIFIFIILISLVFMFMVIVLIIWNSCIGVFFFFILFLL